MINTRARDIYIISAIKETWKQLFKTDFDLNTLQSLDIEELEDPNDFPKSSVHDRVDGSAILLEHTKYTNKEVIGVLFAHYHRQTRKDNYGCTVYILKQG